MAFISQEAVAAAREIDLLSYLQTYEPGELVKLTRDTYCTREHDSLKISNGKWYWFSHNIGGRTALDYLMKVKEMPFQEAVHILTGAPIEKEVHEKPAQEPKDRRILLPEVDPDCWKVRKYLIGRGIHPEVIDYCVEKKLLFQTTQYKNALFVGYDQAGRPRYGALRSTVGAYKSELTGSDKRYSFLIAENTQADTVHVFESAIDLMSYATLLIQDGRDWKQEPMLSLAGVFARKREGVVPVALSRFLNYNPQIRTVHLHLDNDEVGRSAARGIMEGMKDYTVIDEPPAEGKDVNEQLQLRTQRMQEREER